jgi:hypothetical protein
MDIDQKVFIFEVGSSKVDEERAKSEVDARFVGAIEEVEEGPVVFYLSLVFVVFLHVVLIRLK